VAGELARAVRDDEAVVVGRVEDIDRAGFDDEQVKLRVADAEDDLAVAIRARRSVRPEGLHLGVIKFWKRRVVVLHVSEHRWPFGMREREGVSTTPRRRTRRGAAAV